MNRRRGIMLLDFMVAMAIIGIVLLAVMPTLRSDGPLQLIAGSTMLAADIEYAQSRTLSEPVNPTIVVFEADGSAYWLALLSEPETPIDDPDGNAWRRELGVGAASQLEGCTFARHDLPSLPDDGPEVIIFDAFGRLETEGDLAVSIVNAGGSQFVRVREVTGSVEILAALPDDWGVEPEPEPEDDGGGKDGGKTGGTVSGVVGGVRGVIGR